MVGGCGAGVVELEPGSLGAVVELFGVSRVSFRGRPGLPLGGGTKGGCLGAGTMVGGTGGSDGPPLCNLQPCLKVCGAFLSPPGLPCCALHLGHDQNASSTWSSLTYLRLMCVVISLIMAEHMARGYTAASAVLAHP